MTAGLHIPILIVPSNPKNTSPLRFSDEIKQISEVLRYAVLRDQFVLEQRWATRVKDLRRAMLEINSRVVHFGGHGTSEGLAFEDQNGEAQIVEPQALANLFELFAEKVDCVVLACYSEMQAQAIAEHIGCVVGIRSEITDQAAIEFALAFYEALGAGRSYHDAFKFGCNALHLEGIPKQLIPIIHLKPDAGLRPIASVKSSLTTSAAPSPVEIFYSYSHRDEQLRDLLEIHLRILQRQGLITNWHDRRIGPSADWKGEIDSHLDSAHIILLLISAYFINSDYIYDIELRRAMERHEQGQALVVPVILRPCDWMSASFGKLQALPRDGRPIVKWGNRHEAFAQIASEIRQLVDTAKR